MDGAVVKLCAEVGEQVSALEAAEYLLAGCVKLVGAPLISMVWAHTAPGFFQPGSGMLWGADETVIRHINEWFFAGREYVRDPVNRAVRARPTAEAFARRHLVNDPDWYLVEHVDGRRQMGFDDVLTCAHEVPGGRVFISLHRAWGERPFSDADRDLLTLLKRCNAWLLRKLADDRLLAPAAPPLPARLRKVLPELLSARSERDIADELGLSQRTVHKYVEALYRELHVSSRAELMALYIPPPARRVHSPGFRSL